MAASNLQLKTLHQSTFQDKFPGGHNMSQLELEKKYTKLYRKFKARYRKKYGSDLSKWPEKVKTKMWLRFQEQYGQLLAPDKSAANWGEGKPLFKARFTDKGQLSTAAAVNTQTRVWRDQFLTEGTPGIPLDLEKTKGMWIDEATQLNKEVHHIHGISEYEPYIDKTIKKILAGDPAGQREFASFSKEAFDRNVILGSKVENYRALTKPQHRVTPGSAHFRQSTIDTPTYQSDAVITKASGASAFSDETQELLNKLPREGSGRTVWTEAFDWKELTHDARLETIQAAIDDPGNFRPELVGKKKIPNRRVRVGNSFFTYMDELGQTPENAEWLYNMVGGTARDIGADVPRSVGAAGFGQLAPSTGEGMDLYKAGQLAGDFGRRAGALLPVVGAGLDAWDVQQRYDTMMNDPNEGLADWMDKLQFGIASTTLGTSFWAEPINTATGLLNLGIDVVRTGVEEDKRKEFLDLARHAGAQTVKAVGRVF